MQQTRRYILDILRDNGEATVDEIVASLRERRGKDITAVTVRHHLNLLLQQALITSPELRRRSSPGRPQHVYALTERAKDYFPTNYERLLSGIIAQLERKLPSDAVNVILEGVAHDMAQEATYIDTPFEERLAAAVHYLNQHGYDAYTESAPEGMMLYTRNCPYHHIAENSPALCDMDMRLVAALTGIVPRLITRMTQGAPACTYLLPLPAMHGKSARKMGN